MSSEAFMSLILHQFLKKIMYIIMFNEKLNHTLAAFTFYWANKMSTSSKSNDVRVPWNESFIKNGSSRRFFKMASTDNNSVRKWNFLLIWPLPLNFSKHYSLRHVHIYFVFQDVSEQAKKLRTLFDSAHSGNVLFTSVTGDHWTSCDV